MDYLGEGAKWEVSPNCHCTYYFKQVLDKEEHLDITKISDYAHILVKQVSLILHILIPLCHLSQEQSLFSVETFQQQIFISICCFSFY